VHGRKTSIAIIIFKSFAGSLLDEYDLNSDLFLIRVNSVGSSKREDRLNHRHPTRQTRGVRSKRSTIWNFVDSHHLATEP